ncbi:hypothetical protein H8K20_08000 [Neobittarella massiliensis]|uniref:Uncharacterized protein n=1 Tax=Neobittarella massiliensis (ex Bilen et al. 2018) TaxID=2041842 RepID=A0A8J6IPD0_9FIRM|nr:hypothetical protein [Neobittarella massiliensis]MBC3516337.1 hypothetical protein [Neobittarella massiliensis]
MMGRWVIGSVGQQGGELLPDQTGDGAVLLCCCAAGRCRCCLLLAVTAGQQ